MKYLAMFLLGNLTGATLLVVYAALATTRPPQPVERRAIGFNQGGN